MQILSRNITSIVVFMMLIMGHKSQSVVVESVCFGTTSKGQLKHAAKLPTEGENFTTYSYLGSVLGRTYVHSKVAAVLLQTFSELNTRLPDKKFMYAETGWASGGDFSPHKTHQNGLSVDFMVPVVDSKGASAYLPVDISNKWGYDIDFNAAGKYQSFHIDFEAMAEHIKLLHENALSAGFSIKRVYFDPRLQDELFNTKQGGFIKNNLTFNTKQAWVRHDEHYHVDFDIECLPKQ